MSVDRADSGRKLSGYTNLTVKNLRFWTIRILEKRLTMFFSSAMLGWLNWLFSIWDTDLEYTCPQCVKQ